MTVLKMYQDIHSGCLNLTVVNFVNPAKRLSCMGQFLQLFNINLLLCLILHAYSRLGKTNLGTMKVRRIILMVFC